MGFLKLAPRDDLIAAYVAKRGWFTLKTKPMLGDEFLEMYEWCWGNMVAPRLHMISLFDARLEEGCVHTTFTAESESLPGSKATSLQRATYFIEDERDAMFFKLWWVEGE